LSTTDSRSHAIVMVEDDPDLCDLVCRVVRLVADGYEVIAAHDGVAALDALAEHTVPLVITDVNMLRMNGLQLTAAIKEEAPQTQVLLLTAYASPQLERQARTLSASATIAKPFAVRALLALVQTILSSTII
jgi:two-component system, response regulator, stage 0 sporulation protein F